MRKFDKHASNLCKKFREAASEHLKESKDNPRLKFFVTQDSQKLENRYIRWFFESKRGRNQVITKSNVEILMAYAHPAVNHHDRI